MAITFEIPSGQVVSLNSWQRMHWAQRRRLQAEVDKIVYFSAHSERAAFSKIRVSLTQHGRRAMDPDNLIGGTGKVVHDAIVNAGLIPDDGPDHLVIGSPGFQKDKERKVVVRINKLNGRKKKCTQERKCLK